MEYIIAREQFVKQSNLCERNEHEIPKFLKIFSVHQVKNSSEDEKFCMSLKMFFISFFAFVVCTNICVGIKFYDIC